MAIIPVAAAGYGAWIAGAAIAIGTAVAGAVAGGYKIYQDSAKHAPNGPTQEDKAALEKANREAESSKAAAAAARANSDMLQRQFQQTCEEQQRKEEQRQQREEIERQRQEALEREREEEWRQQVFNAQLEFEEQQRRIAFQKQEAEKRKEEALERELEAKKQAEKEKVALLEMLKAQQDQMQQMVARESQQKEEFMQQLKEIQRKEQEAIDYPVPPFLEKQRRNVNIAVTGNSGVGKSSFINAVRRVKPNHPDAAKSEAVECTQEATRYAFPSDERVVTRIGRVRRAVTKNMGKSAKGALGKTVGFAIAKMTATERIVEKVVDTRVDVDTGDKVCFEDGGRVVEGTLLEARSNGMWLLKLPDDEKKEVHEDLFGAVRSGMNIWDLPGVGTTKHPQCDYMKKMGIRHFDMVVLITGNRFTEGEVMLLKELVQFKVPVFLVRNLVDCAIDAEMSKFADNADMSKDEIVVEEQQRITDKVLKTVKDGIAEATETKDFVYCISCLREHREKYDFLKLRAAITEALIAGRELQVASASSLGDVISCVTSTFEDITDQLQSQEVMAEATDSMIADNMILIGNPGTGKSSLINCFTGEAIFQAGVSLNGRGVTFQLDTRVFKGCCYMDTPGLSDVKLRKQAAVAIDTALKQGGVFKLIFVVTLEAGRIKPDDLTTMKLVLEAANQIPKDGYSILINKLSPVYLRRMNKAEILETITETLDGMKVPTTMHITYCQTIPELTDEDNIIVELPSETQKFLEDAPTIITAQVSPCSPMGSVDISHLQHRKGDVANLVAKASIPTAVATINFADFKTTKFSLQDILDEKAKEEVEQTLKLDPANREKYLSDVEFQTVFGMGPDELQKMPKWKRDKIKKEKKLF